MTLSWFFTCEFCTKLHCRAGVGPDSVCACGMKLYRMSWEQ